MRMWFWSGPDIVALLFLSLAVFRLASQGQCIRSGSYNRTEGVLNALVTSLEHKISAGGGALVASLTPSRVLQLFSGSVPSDVQSPCFPGGQENTRRLKRKKSRFEPERRSATSVAADVGGITGVLAQFPF